MATLKKVTANTLLYSFSQMLQRGSSVIFFPIFSSYLSKTDYGIQSISNYLSIYCAVLAGFELNRAVSRLIYEEEASPTFIRRLMGTMFLFQLLVFCVLATLGLIIGPFALKHLLNDIPFFPYITITFLFVPFLQLFNLYKSYLQATHQGLSFMKMDLLFWASNVGLNLLFVVVFGMHVEGLLLSTVISSFLFSLFAFFKYFRHTRLIIDKDILKRSFHFSLPILPFILTGTFLESTDKMVLNNVAGSSAAGLYYIAVMVAGFFSVMKESAVSAIQPWFYQHFEKQSHNQTRKILQTVFTVMALLCVGICWFSNEMLRLLSNNKELNYAWEYIPYITTALLIVFYTQMQTMVVYYTKTKIKWLVTTTLIALAINYCSSTLLIPKYGIQGAAISYLLAMTSLALSTIFITRKFSFQLNHFYIIVLIILCFGLSIAPVIIQMEYKYILVLKILFSVILCSSLFYHLQKEFKVKDFALDWIKKKMNL